MIRLNKHIATHLSLGRRAADELILRGKVLVNGEVAELGRQVSLSDVIEVNGQTLETSVAEKIYVMLNKPIGYVCSRRQQGTTPTIYSLLPSELHHLKPVGRLDKDSSGLLLLTNDGDFAHQMTHPSFHKTKSYEVELDKPLEPLHQQMISDHGVTLEDGVSKFLVEKNKDAYKVIMHEGRNRQIRRTFAALGYEVTKLHRTQFGTYSLNTLKPGEHKKTAL